MTTYSYRCIDCPVTSDRQFPIGEAPDEIAVGPHTLRRVITAPAVHFAEGFSRSSVGGKTK